MTKKNRRGKLAAFSLTELLVVLVIIGILVLLALPRLMPMISKTRAVEAQKQLRYLHTLEKNYFFLHSKYTTILEDIGFEQSTLVKDGGTANYKIEIVEASLSTYKARATSETDFDQDGILNVWEIDQDQKLVEVTKD